MMFIHSYILLPYYLHLQCNNQIKIVFLIRCQKAGVKMKFFAISMIQFTAN